MRYLICLLLVVFGTKSISAQTDLMLDSIERILLVRGELKRAVLSDDVNSGEKLTNSLLKLTPKGFTILMWDERGLLYHWTGQQQKLLYEAEHYSTYKRNSEFENSLIVEDTLFEVLDALMYPKSADYLLHLQELPLSLEQKLFCDLHLQYLLRNNSDEELERRAAYIRQFPKSKYSSYIRNFMELPRKEHLHYFSIDGGLLSNNWTGNLQRSLTPGWGALFGVYYHNKGWILGGKFGLSQSKIAGPVYEGNLLWPRDSAASFRQWQFELGHSVLNLPKARFSLSGTIGTTHLFAPPPEVEDPEYYDGYLNDYFNYTKVSFGAQLTTDLKIFMRKNDARDSKSKTYNGVRLKLGYEWLYFDESNAALSGNLLYFALGYQFSGR